MVFEFKHKLAKEDKSKMEVFYKGDGGRHRVNSAKKCKLNEGGTNKI